MTRPIGIIGAPSSAGAYAPGPEQAAEAWRRNGLAEAIEAAGQQIHDRGDVERFRWRPDPANPEAMNLDAAVRVVTQLADWVFRQHERNSRALFERVAPDPARFDRLLEELACLYDREPDGSVAELARIVTPFALAIGDRNEDISRRHIAHVWGDDPLG